MPSPLSEFLRQFLLEDRLARFEEVVAQRTRHVTIVLENVFHAHNASACLRTCDCFGVQDVHIVESRNSFNPNEDVALGSNQWLTISRYQSEVDAGHPESATAACINQLRQAGYQILATSPRQDSKPLDVIDTSQKTAVVLGAEQTGVSEQAIEMADHLVHIPMYGFTESFNISVSAALCLQQLTAKIRRELTSWQLSSAAREEILEIWVRKSLGSKLEPLVRRFEQENRS